MINNLWRLGCLTQMYFLVLFVGLEAFLPAVMAYDYFVAICLPLSYMVYHIPPDLWTAGSGVLGHTCPAFLVTKLNSVSKVLSLTLGNLPIFSVTFIR